MIGVSGRAKAKKGSERLQGLRSIREVPLSLQIYFLLWKVCLLRSPHHFKQLLLFSLYQQFIHLTNVNALVLGRQMTVVWSRTAFANHLFLNNIPIGFVWNFSSCNHETIGIMVNFMCQLNQAISCTDIQPKIILNLLIRVFLDEINI